MTAVLSLFVVLTLSFLVTRLATAALTLTGVSHELARLQAISAFTGVGFTTSESEALVDHPVRRRVLMLLMILGNAGVVTAISSLILSFTGLEQRAGYLRAAWILGGLILLWLVARSRWVDKSMHRLMRRVLDRSGAMRAYDYARLLDLRGDYVVSTHRVNADDWMANRNLGELKLFQEGISVLGIHRSNGDYVGVPRGETEIEQGDVIVLYGLNDDIDELRSRRRDVEGEQEHAEAVAEQRDRRAEQRRKESERRSEQDAAASAAAGENEERGSAFRSEAVDESQNLS